MVDDASLELAVPVPDQSPPLVCRVLLGVQVFGFDLGLEMRDSIVERVVV